MCGRWKMTTVCYWLYPVVETKKMSLVKPKPWKVASSHTCKLNRQLASSMCPTLALLRFDFKHFMFLYLHILLCFKTAKMLKMLLLLSSCYFFSFGFTASLCGSDFSTLWILREPLVTSGPGPSQQHIQHFPSPHDCHRLCLITSIFFLN